MRGSMGRIEAATRTPCVEWSVVHFSVKFSVKYDKNVGMVGTSWMVFIALSASSQLVLPSGLSPTAQKHRDGLVAKHLDAGRRKGRLS